MTRLTREIALSEMPQRNMRPNKLMMIMPMVRITTIADQRSNPSRTNVTRKMQRAQLKRFVNVSLTIVRYCS